LLWDLTGQRTAVRPKPAPLVLAIWGALYHQGPFVTQSPADNLISLQLFFLVISLPSMFSAAAMAERMGAFAGLLNAGG
jgi:hypothetical protein